MRGLVLPLLLTGCASKGFQYPGPLGGVGSEPPPYADQIEPEAPAAESAVVWKPRIKKKSSKKGGAVAVAAGSLVGKKKLVVSQSTFRYDCSGLVTAAYTKAGIELNGNTSSLHAMAKKKGTLHDKKTPEVGDMVFFDNTWDRNGNGRRDDSLTHIAIVETIDSMGTMTLVHLGGKGVVRIQMNLYHPSIYKNDEGVVLNSYLRRGSSGERLTGQLWVGFASMWDADFSDAVSMNWIDFPLEGPSAI